MSAKHRLASLFTSFTSGTVTVLYHFCAQANCTDGGLPQAGLVLGADRNFYGVTTYGGDTALCKLGCGTVFKITPRGALTVLHTFEIADGEAPQGPLVQGIDGNFYGTTEYGGTAPPCVQASMAEL